MDWVYREFGRRVRRCRKDAKLSQEELASRVSLSRTSITNIERGRQRVPLHSLFVLAAAVGVDPSVLLPNSSDAAVDSTIPPELLEGLGERDKEFVKRIVATIEARKAEAQA